MAVDTGDFSYCRAAWWSYCPELEAPGARNESTLMLMALRGNASLPTLNIGVLPGMWCPACATVRDAFMSEQFVMCPRIGSCEVGGPLRQDMRCAPGHTGAACAACESGWVPRDGSPCAPCVKCDSDSTAVLATISVLAALVLGVLGYLAYSAVSTRGEIMQDLLFGALRVIGMYASLMTYVIAAFAPAAEDSLGMTTRAISLDNWYGACGRTDVSAHRSRVLESARTVNQSLSATPWLSDELAYTEPAEGTATGFADSVMQVVGGLSGALPVSSTELTGCISSHADFASTARLNMSLLLGMFGLLAAASGIFALWTSFYPAWCKGTASAGASAKAGRKATLTEAVTANPIFAGREKSPVASTSTAAGKEDKGAKVESPPQQTMTPQLMSWAALRFIASLCLFLWAGAMGAALQVLAPGLSLGGGEWVSAASMSTDILTNRTLVGLGVAAVGVFGFAIPLAMLVFLRGRAVKVLDNEHHASVTVAILTTGYRLQLNAQEAKQLVRQQMSSESRDKQKLDVATNAAVLYMAQEVSRRMESRCCGLAKYVPSHGYALVRQMQTVMVLCALWLLLEPLSRAITIITALVAAIILTYTLQPYALPELNRLDMQASLAVALHVIVLMAGGWPILSTGVWVFHALTGSVLIIAVARGASAKSRELLALFNAWLKARLPELEKDNPTEIAGEGVNISNSAPPGITAIARALLVKLGCTCLKQKQPTKRSQVGMSRMNSWKAFAADAVTAMDSAAAVENTGGSGNGAISDFLASVTGDAESGATSGVCCGRRAPETEKGAVPGAAPGTELSAGLLKAVQARKLALSPPAAAGAEKLDDPPLEDVPGASSKASKRGAAPKRVSLAFAFNSATGARSSILSRPGNNDTIGRLRATSSASAYKDLVGAEDIGSRHTRAEAPSSLFAPMRSAIRLTRDTAPAELLGGGGSSAGAAGAQALGGVSSVNLHRMLALQSDLSAADASPSARRTTRRATGDRAASLSRSVTGGHSPSVAPPSAGDQSTPAAAGSVRPSRPKRTYGAK